MHPPQAPTRMWAIYGYIPANLEWDHYVEEYFTMQRLAQIGLYFFFSSELSYSPASPQVTASRVFHVHSSDRQKPLAKPVFIGENIGVCLSQDSPHHPRKRSTDWPVKRRYWRSGFRSEPLL